MGYEDPVNATYDATTEMYERVASHLLESVDALTPRSIHVTFATHTTYDMCYTGENNSSHVLLTSPMFRKVVR